MQENKYFTPEIEDIRVGYECEINKSLFNGISEGWHNFIFKEFEQLEVINKNGLKAFRVLYLTKEQIEAEGWTWLSDSSMYKKNEHVLIFSPFGNSKIEIRYLGHPGFQYTSFFLGECKDINNFRYICKLLEI